MLPLSYAIRNLFREPWRFAQKLAGSTLVLLLMLSAGAFNTGMLDLLGTSGSEHKVILLGAGSEESVERSQIPLAAETIATASVRGIEERAGLPAVSGEVVYMGLLQTAEPTKNAQGLIRGVTPTALEVHREIRLLEGTWPRSGEVLVGALAHHLLEVDPADLQVGGTVRFEDQTFRISGRFDAMGTVMESEIWFDRTDLMALIQRETLSCVYLRLQDTRDRAHVDLFAKQRLDLELSAVSESEYYAKLSRFYGPIRAMTWLTAVLVAVGAVMGGLNILYASYASRVREFGTLQTLGYGRWALLWSLVQEALLVQACGFGLTLLFGLAVLDGRMVTFSMGTFALDLSGGVLLLTLFTALFLGTVGSFPPALRCLALPIPSALKSAP
jgi:putative ABC transport system permease protein